MYLFIEEHHVKRLFFFLKKKEGSVVYGICHFLKLKTLGREKGFAEGNEDPLETP